MIVDAAQVSPTSLQRHRREWYRWAWARGLVCLAWQQALGQLYACEFTIVTCVVSFFLLGQSPFHALRNEFAFNKRVYNLFLGQKSLFQLLSNCFYSVSGQQKKQTTNNFQECPTLLAAPHFENASSCSNSTPMSTFQNIHTVKYSLIVVLMKFWLIKLKPYNL